MSHHFNWKKLQKITKIYIAKFKLKYLSFQGHWLFAWYHWKFLIFLYWFKIREIELKAGSLSSQSRGTNLHQNGTGAAMKVEPPSKLSENPGRSATSGLVVEKQYWSLYMYRRVGANLHLFTCKWPKEICTYKSYKYFIPFDWQGDL